jgi:opacity protein-like surface antigen
MRLKKLGAALVVVAALGAVLASSALAAAVTQDVKWYTGASPGTVLSGSETMSASLVGTATFTTEVGTTKYIVQTKKSAASAAKSKTSSESRTDPGG